MRTRLFSDEPVAELRGLATLTDPDEGVVAVIDIPVIGARGDGKTQFIVHAIRALRAHAPALVGSEQTLNRDVLRVVLDPRAPRSDPRCYPERSAGPASELRVTRYKNWRHHLFGHPHASAHANFRSANTVQLVAS